MENVPSVPEFLIGLGVVLRPIADMVFPRVVGNKIELGVLQRERFVQGFEESCFPGLVLYQQGRSHPPPHAQPSPTTPFSALRFRRESRRDQTGS